MLTIKKKLIALIAAVLAVSLGTVAVVLVSQERAKVIDSITQTSLHFAELSSERLAELYDLYYRSQSYALFESEFQKIVEKNPAIERVELASAEGELLFSSALNPADSLPLVHDATLLARLRVNRTSVATDERVIYLSTARHAAGYHFEDAEARAVTALAPSDKVATIVYPLADDRRRAIFHLSYAAADARVQQALIYLAGLFLLAFVGAFLVSTRFASTLTAPLGLLRVGAQRIARGDLTTKIEVHSHDETKLLADTFNQMTTDLSAALDQKVQYERAAKEVEVAREIQASTLPATISIPGLDFAIHFEPATEVGGDMYDCLTRSDERTLFYLGDATGHGVPAGMVAALTSAIMATAAADARTLPAILQQANSILHRKTKKSMFMTLLALEWDQRTHELNFASAGHELPLIYRADGKEIEAKGSGTLGLGMLAKLTPEPVEQTIALQNGDYLLVFTDGIFEARNEGDEQLGMDGLQRIFAAACALGGSAEAVLDRVITKTAEFRGTVKAEDDITVFVVRLA